MRRTALALEEVLAKEETMRIALSDARKVITAAIASGLAV
jgi:hypothetical protein